MKIEKYKTTNYKDELKKTLINMGYTMERAESISGYPEIWELEIDDDIWLDMMRTNQKNKELILKFFQIYPDELEIWIDDIEENYTKNDWDVNMWRNS